MTKLELIENLALYFDDESENSIKINDVKTIVYSAFEQICQSLESGDRIEIRGFGSFSLHHREARLGRNPKTGEKVQVQAKAIPHFRAGKEMRHRINESLSKIDIIG